MQQERRPCGYMLAGQRYDTLYIGVTSDLVGRMWINLINESNPHWADLAVGLGLPPLEQGGRQNGS